jgi:ADP-ribose pyrophosphatase YjhB (NUDIX family)
MRISDENLHISSFALVKSDADSILLLRATDAHPLSFRRGKLMLPATMLQFGEKPADAAHRAVNAQLTGVEGATHRFADLQSYVGSHWDIVIVFQFDVPAGAKITAKAPFADAAYYKLSSLPRSSIAEDHLEVIDGLSSRT